MHLILWFSGLFLHFPLVWWRFDKVLCENPFKVFVWSSRLSPVNVTLKLMSTNIIPGTRFEQTLYHLENTFFYITKNLLIINWCRAMLVNCIWINPGCLVQHLIGSWILLWLIRWFKALTNHISDESLLTNHNSGVRVQSVGCWHHVSCGQWSQQQQCEWCVECSSV